MKTWCVFLKLLQNHQHTIIPKSKKNSHFTLWTTLRHWSTRPRKSHPALNTRGAICWIAGADESVVGIRTHTHTPIHSYTKLRWLNKKPIMHTNRQTPGQRHFAMVCQPTKYGTDSRKETTTMATTDVRQQRAAEPDKILANY